MKGEEASLSRTIDSRSKRNGVLSRPLSVNHVKNHSFNFKAYYEDQKEINTDLSNKWVKKYLFVFLPVFLSLFLIYAHLTFSNRPHNKVKHKNYQENTEMSVDASWSSFHIRYCPHYL